MKMNSLRKNTIVPLKITGMTSDGAGVGRHEGMAVFVPGTAPGDEIDCKIVKVLKSYCFGIVEAVLVPSEDRIEPDCPYFSKCGGCVYRHIRVEAEMKIKTERVRDAIERVGGFENMRIQPMLGIGSRSHYRNKAQLPLGIDENGALTMGCYAVHSHRIINIDSCLLLPEIFTQVMCVFRTWFAKYGSSVYSEITHKGLLRHLYLRRGEKTDALMVCVVINGKTLPNSDRLVERLVHQVPAVQSIMLNHNTENTNVILGKSCTLLWGAETISDILCDLKFDISPLSFYQVNRTQAERLYQKAAEYAALSGSELLMDLYCGTGTIGLSMAKQAKRLIGVEIIPEAVENARQNAQKNGIENVEFLCADAGEAAQLFNKRGEKPDVVVVDPPRRGCTQELIQAVVLMSPARVIYVSCDPATLSRDLRIFQNSGYTAQELTLCDLFPGTAHVECVCLLTKNK